MKPATLRRLAREAERHGRRCRRNRAAALRRERAAAEHVPGLTGLAEQAERIANARLDAEHWHLAASFWDGRRTAYLHAAGEGRWPL